MMITIRVHDVHVSVKDENPGPHLMAIGYMPDGQELIRGRIYAGHAPSVQFAAVAEVASWLRKHRPGWDIATLPGEGVVPHTRLDGLTAGTTEP